MKKIYRFFLSIILKPKKIKIRNGIKSKFPNWSDYLSITPNIFCFLRTKQTHYYERIWQNNIMHLPACLTTILFSPLHCISSRTYISERVTIYLKKRMIWEHGATRNHASTMKCFLGTKQTQTPALWMWGGTEFQQHLIHFLQWTLQIHEVFRVADKQQTERIRMFSNKSIKECFSKDKWSDYELWWKLSIPISVYNSSLPQFIWSFILRN